MKTLSKQQAAMMDELQKDWDFQDVCRYRKGMDFSRLPREQLVEVEARLSKIAGSLRAVLAAK